jgi:hypothetical protein
MDDVIRPSQEEPVERVLGDVRAPLGANRFASAAHGAGRAPESTEGGEAEQR